MTSLAVLPHLRRTLTDVMEDELYHVPTSPHQQPNTNNAPTQQSQVMTNLLWNNSNQSFKQSPTLAHSKIFRNSSALNSEEMLTIPDEYTHQQHTQQYQPVQSIQPELLMRVPSHDMYFDIPEEPTNVFNEFGNPNLTTTNQSLELTYHPVEDAAQPPKLLKFNEDLTLECFNTDEDPKLVIFPGCLSPNLIPEQLEDEEISDDEDDDEGDFDMTYLDDDVAQGQVDQTNLHQQVPDLLYSSQSQHPHRQQQLPVQQHHNQQQLFLQRRPSLSRDSTELESDIDRMSLASEDDSSDSVEDEEEEPTFNMNMKKRPLSVASPTLQTHQPLATQQQQKVQAGSQPASHVFTPSPTVEPSNITTQDNAGEGQGPHQCKLVNNQTGAVCLKRFSRPYDLIRHQETIHASRKKIFRCVVCTQMEGGASKKTFSRGDALSRHVRVKHGLTGDEVVNAMKYAKDHVEYA